MFRVGFDGGASYVTPFQIPLTVITLVKSYLGCIDQITNEIQSAFEKLFQSYKYLVQTTNLI